MVELLHLEQDLHRAILVEAVEAQQQLHKQLLQEELGEMVQRQVLTEHLQLFLVVAVEVTEMVVLHQTHLVDQVVEEEVVLDQDQVLPLNREELMEQLTLVVEVVQENLNVLLLEQVERMVVLV